MKTTKSQSRIHVFMAAAGRARSIGRSFWSLAGSMSCMRRSISRMRTSGTSRGSAGGRCRTSRERGRVDQHRGTIGKHFSIAWIRAVQERNRLLFSWKNIHEPRRLIAHFAYTVLRANRRGCGAVKRLPKALRVRRRARRLARFPMRRRSGGLWAVFSRSLCGAGFLAVARIVRVALCDLSAESWRRGVHVQHGAGAGAVVRTALADRPLGTARGTCGARGAGTQGGVGGVLRPRAIEGCAGSYSRPYAARDFAYKDLAWAVQRIMYTRKIDVVQIEYTNMAQYGGEYGRLACALFEHDVYFQSVGRALTIGAAWEYLRALRFELGRCRNSMWCRRAIARMRIIW